MRVLIVDDEHERHENFRVVLKGHRLHHAMCYDEAVACLKWNTYELVCLDYDLGEIKDGRDVAEWLAVRPERCPPQVLVDTDSVVGAKGIAESLAALRKDRGIRVVKKSFSLGAE